MKPFKNALISGINLLISSEMSVYAFSLASFYSSSSSISSSPLSSPVSSSESSEVLSSSLSSSSSPVELPEMVLVLLAELVTFCRLRISFRGL